MVADDSVLLREGIVRLLEEAGFEGEGTVSLHGPGDLPRHHVRSSGWITLAKLRHALRTKSDAE